MESAVGIVGMSIADFYISEPREINIILEGYAAKQEREFQLNQIAVSNAIGLNFKKGYKATNPFEEQKAKAKSAQSSKEEKKETLDFLFNKFNRKVGDE